MKHFRNERFRVVLPVAHRFGRIWIKVSIGSSSSLTDLEEFIDVESLVGSFKFHRDGVGLYVECLGDSLHAVIEAFKAELALVNLH